MDNNILVYLLIAFIAYNLLSKEGFALTTGPNRVPGSIFTDKTLLDPNIYYVKGTLKAGVTSTITPAQNGGATCGPFPAVVYKVASPVDATCGDNVDGNYTFETTYKLPAAL